MIFLIDIPIYNKEVVFVFGSDKTTVRKWLEGNGYYGREGIYFETLKLAFSPGHNGIVVPQDGNYKILVWVDRVDCHRTIAHEIYHVACKIMEWVGVHQSPLTEEAYAYLIGYITDEVYERLSQAST